MATKAEKTLARRESQLANIRRSSRMAKARTTRTLSRFGGGYLGGALFGSNFELAALAGLAGVGLNLAGKGGPVADMLEGAGVGAAYCYAKENPPEFLKGIADSISDKVAEVKDSL